MVSKKNEKVQIRIAKGNNVIIKASWGKKISGTYVRAQGGYIVLMRNDATIDVEDIVWIKVVSENPKVYPVLGSGIGAGVDFGMTSSFNAKDWKMIVKEIK